MTNQPSFLDFSYVADPPSGRPPLLLVHGFLSSHNHWLENVPRLSQRYRCIRVDLPAHGRTRVPADPQALTPDALVESLDRLRAALGIDRWAICGQSFGAGLTLRYALQIPKRITSQVFTNANTALRPVFGPEQAAALTARIAALKVGGRDVLRAQKFHPLHAKRFAPGIKAQLIDDAEHIDIPGLIAVMQTTMPAMNIRARIGDIICPTLLVNGRWESSFQPIRDACAAAIPGLEVVDLEGGHSINIEQPELFDAAVISFLDRFT